MTAAGHRGYTNLSGDPMAADRLSRICKALAAEAGLPPIRLQNLQRGAASGRVALAGAARRDNAGH